MLSKKLQTPTNNQYFFDFNLDFHNDNNPDSQSGNQFVKQHKIKKNKINIKDNSNQLSFFDLNVGGVK